MVGDGVWNFPSFSEGLSLRRQPDVAVCGDESIDFPSFSEGLSLRPVSRRVAAN